MRSEQAADHYAIAHQQLSQLGAQKELERIDREWQALAAPAAEAVG